MQFSTKEWKRMYDKIQELGQMLKDSYPDARGNEPLINLSYEGKLGLQSDIKNLCVKVNRYLDHCGMRPNKPLWHYDLKNKKTWASHESFKYVHLMRF